MTIETLAWVDRFGSSHTWPLGKLQGITGLGMPPVQHVNDSVLNVAGAQVLADRFGKRRITVPFVLHDTEGNTRAALRNWALWLDTTIAEGYLVISTLLGDTRTIRASYVGGLELVQEAEHFLQATIQFDCFDPFFYDNTLSASVPLSTETAIAGDIPVWPIASVRRNDFGFLNLTYTINGPSRVGYKLTADMTAAARLNVAKTLVWDSRPGIRTMFYSGTYYADPVAQYLSSPASFNIVPFWSNASPNMLWFQVPYDRYSSSGVPNGTGGTTAGTAYITAATSGTLSDLAWQFKYFAGWLAA